MNNSFKLKFGCVSLFLRVVRGILNLAIVFYCFTYIVYLVDRKHYGSYFFNRVIPRFYKFYLCTLYIVHICIFNITIEY